MAIDITHSPDPNMGTMAMEEAPIDGRGMVKRREMDLGGGEHCFDYFLRKIHLFKFNF